MSLSYTATDSGRTGLMSLIRRSSKYKRFQRQRQSLKSLENPCLGKEAVNILSGQMNTVRVTFRQLFRFASCADYFLMGLGLIFICGAAVSFAGAILLSGIRFHYFDHSRDSTGCSTEVNQRLAHTAENWFLIVTVCFMVFSSLFSFCFHLSAQRQEYRLRLAHMEAVCRKNRCWFESTYTDRDTYLRMGYASDIRGAVGEAFPRAVFSVLTATLMLLLCLYISYHHNPLFIVILEAPFFSVVSYLKCRADMDLKRKEYSLYKPSSRVAREMLSIIRTIKAFGGGAKAVAVYKSSLFPGKLMTGSILKAAVYSGLFWFIPMAGHALLSYWLDVFHDKIPVESAERNIPELSALVQPAGNETSNCGFLHQTIKGLYAHFFGTRLLMYMAAIFSSHYMSYVPVWIQRIRTAQFNAAELYFAIDWTCTIDSLSEVGRRRGRAVGELAMEQVSFNYPIRNKRVVLRNIDLSIFSGQRVAIFGPSKSGKTTILNLFVRMYDPCSGEVRLDGLDLTECNLGWLRTQVTLVPQDPQFMIATVEDNIRGPIKTGTIEDVMKACSKATVLSDILDLPQGFQTIIGSQSSVKLSRTQMKKMALARAFFRKSRVILLDDFFADASMENEELMENLAALHGDKTIVMTCTKINSLIKDSDTIFVMEKGQILQYGNHENMIGRDNKGPYLKLLESTLEAATNYSIQKPRYDSQLLYYKYAEAITRLHNIRDHQVENDYEVILKIHPVVDSVLFRHDVSTDKHKLNVQPRYIGGFYRFFIYDMDSDILHSRRLFRNELLKNRDLRSKLFSHPDTPEYLVARSGIQKYAAKRNKRRWSRFVNCLNWGNQEERKSLDRASKFDLIKHGCAGCGLPIAPESEEDQQQDRERTDSDELLIVGERRGSDEKDGTGGGASTLSVDREGSRGTVVDAEVEKQRHYFGMALNSPVDTESISSDDSNYFWDDYGNRLQLTSLTAKNGSKLEALVALERKWGLITFCVLTNLIMGAATIIYVYFRGKYEKAQYIGDKDVEVSMCYSIIAISGIAACTAFVQELIVGFYFRVIVNQYANAYFEDIVEQKMEFFDCSQNDVGTLCDTIAVDVSSHNTCVLAMTTVYTESLAILLGSVFLVFFIVPLTNIVNTGIAGGICAYIILVGWLQGNSDIDFVKDGKLLEPLSSIFHDFVMCNKDIICLGWARHMLQKYKVALREIFQPLWYLIFKDIVFGLSQGLIFFAFALWYLEDSHRTKDDILEHFVVLSLFLQAMSPIGYACASVPTPAVLASCSGMIIQTRKYARAKRAAEKDKITVPTSPSLPPQDIRLVDVTFSFPTAPSQRILNGISLEFESGKYVAIVGSAVSGKSTLVGLLLRMYSPTKGEMYLGDYSYNDVTESSFVQSITVIEQDPGFFNNASISENIAFGDNSREVLFEEVVAASKLALIHDIIETFPKKYETKIKDLDVSPKMFAFKQRLGVARAAVSGAKIIIVDGATVSVDEESTDLLLEAMLNLREGKTLIVMSDRIDPIRHAEHILVLKQGRIVESGTDTELIANRGEYYDLLMSQRLYETNAIAGFGLKSSYLKQRPTLVIPRDSSVQVKSGVPNNFSSGSGSGSGSGSDASGPVLPR